MLVDRTKYSQAEYQAAITITPHSDGTQLAYLRIKLDITSPPTYSDAILLSLQNEFSNTPSQKYGKDSVLAKDESGEILLTKDDCKIPGRQTWSVQRTTEKKYSVFFHAFPRQVDENTAPGARVDLRRDQGGLQGAGKSFIPLPLWAEDQSVECAISVQWDISQVSNTTRTIWTFGEGPSSIQVAGNLAYYIWDSQFMVGPVLSYPHQPIMSTSIFGMYWFGLTTPKKITNLGRINETLFSHMARFFEPDLLGQQPYRIFVRRATPAHSFGGTALSRSYVLDYDETIANEQQSNIEFILAHEMVHNWLLMDDETDGFENGWYMEGIAHYYAAILPWRFGLKSEETCRQEINNLLLAYYTNPYRLSKERDILNDWSNFMKIDLTYSRGFTFMIKIDHLIRSASKGSASLDNVALQLLEKRRNRRTVQQKDWILVIAQYIDRKAVILATEEALGGELIVPFSITLPNHRLEMVYKESMELGFAINSIRSHVISGLIPGSRAETAGLRNGDCILSITPLRYIMQKFAFPIKLRIRRGKSELQIEYWPRTMFVVTCWEFQSINNHGPGQLSNVQTWAK